MRFVLSLLVAAAVPVAAAEVLEGRIVDVGAGDTATLEQSGGARRALRLHAVAAPTGRQPYAAESRRALGALVQGKAVRFEVQREDDYRRLIGKLLVAAPDCTAPCTPTRDAGLAQLEAGLAWWYRDERKQQTLHDQGYYEYAEYDARMQRRGLWRDEAPLPPWEWRKRQGATMAEAAGVEIAVPPAPTFTPKVKPVTAGAATGLSL